SAEQRQRPVGAVLVLEREEHDALPLAEAEAAVAERHLFRPRAEKRMHETLAGRGVSRYDALEQAFEVLEETRLALLHTDERQAVRRGDVGDAVAALGARN